MILDKERYLCVLEDIFLYQGDFKEINIRVKGKGNSEIILNGVVVTFIVCDIDMEDVVYIEKDGINKLNNTMSVINILSSETSSIPMGKYRYKIEIKYNTGNKNIGKGYLTIM